MFGNLFFCASGRGGVRLCCYWVFVLRVDAAKMCAVDAMFTSVFLGTVYVFRMLCSKRSGRVSIVAVW
jgi:hypothetical protein